MALRQRLFNRFFVSMLTSMVALALAADDARAQPKVPDPGLVYIVPIAGAPSVGDRDARVTIVAAFDPASPTAARARATARKILTDHAGKVRMVYKHYLAHARSSALPPRAACAAQKQGKFVELSERISPVKLDADEGAVRAELALLAESLGLDMKKFASDFDGGCTKIVAKDHLDLTTLGLRQASAFFVNGRFVSGDRPLAELEQVIDEEMARAAPLMARDRLTADQYYDQYVLVRGEPRFKWVLGERSVRKPVDKPMPRVAKTEPPRAQPARSAPAPTDRPRRVPGAEHVYPVSIEGAPYKGVRDAKVTIVLATELEGSESRKARDVVTQLLGEYRGSIKVAYRHFIVNAATATAPAFAACAAGLQGKFDAMESAIWKHGKEELTTASLEQIASKAGVDMKRYRQDRDRVCDQLIDKDQRELGGAGAREVPSFYVNGRFVSGFRPAAELRKLINEELEKANARIASGAATVATYYSRFVLRHSAAKVVSKDEKRDDEAAARAEAERLKEKLGDSRDNRAAAESQRTKERLAAEARRKQLEQDKSGPKPARRKPQKRVKVNCEPSDPLCGL